MARVWGQGGPTVEVGASALRCHPRGQQEGRGATPTKAPLTPPTRGPASARWAPSGHRWQPRHARLCSVTARGVPGRWQVSRVAEPLAEHTGPTKKPVTPFQLLPLDQGPSDPSALSRRGVPGKPRGLQASSGSALPRVQPLSISAPGEGRSLREDLGVAPSAGAGQTAGLTHTAPSRGIASSLFRASGLQPHWGLPRFTLRLRCKCPGHPSGGMESPCATPCPSPPSSAASYLAPKGDIESSACWWPSRSQALRRSSAPFSPGTVTRPGGAEAGSGTQATGQTVASLDAPVAALPGPTRRREVLQGGEGAWLTLPGTGFPPTQTGAVFLVQRECLCVLLRVATDPPSAWGRQRPWAGSRGVHADRALWRAARTRQGWG